MADRNDLIEQWRLLAPAWIKESREGKNPSRTGLLDPPVLEACGDVTGLAAIDSGCGEGRFCRILASRGARYVLGLDLCDGMIEAARRLQSGTDEYRVADAQNLGFLNDGIFDLAVSYLNHCDLMDFESNCREIHRVLKPGGRFVVANLHPMRSAVGGWHRSETDEKQHVILDRYFEEGERCWKLMEVNLTNFHRTLSTYINGFIQTGFEIRKIIEPSVTAENLRKYPELADELRVPNFIIYILIKP